MAEVTTTKKENKEEIKEITKEETKAMLDNKVSDCGYDMNSIFHGYDILYFKGSGERSRSNAVGVNINKQIISYGL